MRSQTAKRLHRLICNTRSSSSSLNTLFLCTSIITEQLCKSSIIHKKALKLGSRQCFSALYLSTSSVITPKNYARKILKFQFSVIFLLYSKYVLQNRKLQFSYNFRIQICFSFLLINTSFQLLNEQYMTHEREIYKDR